MHLSAKESSPHYSPFSHYARVFFNGEEVHDCEEASEEQQCIWQWERNEDGTLKTFRCEKTGLLEARLLKRYGKVEIRVPTEAVP